MTFEGFFFWFAITTTLTYAVTGSQLFRRLRVLVAVRAHKLTSLVYCPVCFGFWVAVGTASLFPYEGSWRYALSPACFVTLVLLAKLVRSDFLGVEDFEREATLIREGIEVAVRKGKLR